jgi:excisionase family DNA binding protein
VTSRYATPRSLAEPRPESVTKRAHEATSQKERSALSLLADTLRTPSPLLLKVEDVAKALSVGRIEVYKLIQSGDLPSIKIERLRRVSTEELRAWVKRKSGDSV